MAFLLEYLFSLATLENDFALEGLTQSDDKPGRVFSSLKSTTIGRAGCVNFKVYRKYSNPADEDMTEIPRRSSTEGVEGHRFDVVVVRKGNRNLPVKLIVDVDNILLEQKEPGMSKSTPSSIVRATIESCKIVGTDVSVVQSEKHAHQVLLVIIVRVSSPIF